MSWLPTFTALQGAWLFALSVPLIALYFLKLKRPLLLVPSTALWQRVLDDQRVNSPFQRFKRHLLLWLQLLLLFLLALAAMQPVLRSPEEALVRRPVFVDNSASMAAISGGQSRLDEAKELVGQLIDDLLPEQQLAIISFAGRARSRCGFTGNKRQLRAALASIEVEDVPSDLDGAMRVARALSRGASFDEALVVSDGNLPKLTHTELSFDLRVKLVAQAGDNLGITQVGARRADDGDWLVFVEIAGTAEELVATLTLTAEDGSELGTERIGLGAVEGDEESTFLVRRLFRISAASAGPLTMTLTPDGFDALKSDDVAYLDLPRPRPLRVYVSDALAAWHYALATLKGLAVDREPSGRYDLAITDRAEDLGVDAGVVLTIGLRPPALDGMIDLGIDDRATEPVTSEVVDWRRRDELLLHVGLAEVVILAEPTWIGDASESSLEQLGYVTLIHGRKGPLLLRQGQSWRYHLLFHTDRSTLPYRVGFPVMVSNLVDLARRSAGLAEVRGLKTGVLPQLALDEGRYAEAALQVDGPRPGAVVAAKDGMVRGVAAPLVGRYTLRHDGEVAAAVGVALLTASETRLTRVEKIKFNESLAVGVDESEVRTDRELWQWLSLIALGILCVEWWCFHLMGRRLQ